MSLPEAIDALLAFVPDGHIHKHPLKRRGYCDWLHRFDDLDRAVWREACRCGLETKLPNPPVHAFHHLASRHLGSTKLLVLETTAELDLVGLREWRSKLVALRAIALAAANAGELKGTAAAAFKIIKGLNGRGITGKELIKELKKVHIVITLPTLQKHIVPILKQHGVGNIKALGGYFIDGLGA